MIPKDGVRKNKSIVLVALLVGIALSVLTFLYVKGVKDQLWEQSISTILESTQQGCNTLRIQLLEELGSLDTVSTSIEGYSLPYEQELEEQLREYSVLDHGVSLYLPDGTCIPASAQQDKTAAQALSGNDRESGIVDPHISSVTGVNVFHLFRRVVMADGTVSYLVKEYEVDSIVDSFSLSFYHDAGFSYIINTQGDVLIRPPHPNSNKTVQNLFDMLPEEQNSPDSLAQFRQSLVDFRTGWAVFTYEGAKTVFCYTPLHLQTDWHLISIIPQDVVTAQTNQILLQTLTLVVLILLGIAVLAVLYLHYVHGTNRRLRNQAEYIVHLYNAIPEGIALLSVDPPYRLLQLNQEGLRLLHYPEGSHNDAPKGSLLQDVLHPDDYQTSAEIFQRTVLEERKNSFENRVLQSDGNFFWSAGIVEKTLDENGDPVLIATFHDITAEKLAAEAETREMLQERVTLVGAISNAYPVIIRLNLTKDSLHFVYTKPGLMVNMGAQTTYQELYEDFLATVHPESLGEFQRRFMLENLRQTLGKEKSEVYLEAKQMLTDGQYHWTSIQIIYIDNPYSADRLAMLISRRIDEQRYEEEQQRQALQSALDSARAASEAKGQFLSNMSHDIRTPMNAIVGMTAIAATHLDDRERVISCLQKISMSSNHLLSLINDVLDMSKIESGKLSLREEPFNFAELMAEVVDLVRPQAEAKQLSLDMLLMSLKQENVIGDPLRIRQICINIMSNAVKYTPAGGNIQVEVWQENSARRGVQQFLFRCTDSGVGMDADFLEKLFLPFERSQNSTNSKVAGTGLGMAITKNLVDLMNGDIQVISRPEEGSIFTVTLPLQLQDAQPEEVPAAWRAVRSLIVDDDQQICENAVELLEDMGLRAQFATDGPAAIRCVTQARQSPDPFQLVIIDWKMPDMDGVETARRIRSELGPDVPVIILTAYDWAEIEVEAKAAGVTAFLSKPFYRSKICYLLRELQEDSPATEPPGKDAPQYHGEKRLLLVEDNALNREIARTLIEEMGIQIEEAYDGEDAVKKVATSPEGYFDLILMDIQMPKMDGYAATKAIRTLSRQDVHHMPIIAMTANAFEEDVRAALRAGMNAHFAKPIDLDALKQLFQQYLPG